jgi:hypothetical protein
VRVDEEQEDFRMYSLLEIFVKQGDEDSRFAMRDARIFFARVFK